MKLRIKYLEAHPVCECCEKEQLFPLNPATQIHHKKGRIGSLLTDQRFFVALCGECHEFIELNPDWAKLNGYSLSRVKESNNEKEI